MATRILAANDHEDDIAVYEDVDSSECDVLRCIFESAFGMYSAIFPSEKEGA